MLTFNLNQIQQIGRGYSARTTCTDDPFCLTVSLRMLFSMDETLTSRWDGPDDHPVEGATVTIGGETAQTSEASGGDAFFSFEPRGEVRALVLPLVIEPPERKLNTADSGAGPDTGESLRLTPENTGGSWRSRAMLYRPVRGIVIVEITPAGLRRVRARLQDGTTHARVAAQEQRLVVDYRPDFIQSVRFSSRGEHGIDKIVLHRTGSDDIGSTLNTFMLDNAPPGTTNQSAHYVVDQDGFVVKMVQNGSASHHVSSTYWAGETNVKESSIGIEIVGRPSADLPQYGAVADLVSALRTAHGVSRHRVLAHSSVLVQPGTYNSSNTTCPEPNFRWARLEAAGVVTRAYRRPDLNDPSIETPWDAQIKQKYAGYLTDGADPPNLISPTNMARFNQNAVRRAQEGLVAVGYAVSAPDQENGSQVNGTLWGTATEWAIKSFRRRFVLDPDESGNVSWTDFDSTFFDLRTARALESVLADLSQES